MSGSVELAPLNEMACPASPLYGPPALAVGGRFNTTAKLTLADPRFPAASSASTVMVCVPSSSRSWVLNALPVRGTCVP